MYEFVAVATVYLGCVAFSSIYRFRQLAKCRRAFLNDEDRKAASLSWAWLSKPELMAMLDYWGKGRLGDILDYPPPRPYRMLLPHVSVSISAAVIYQLLRVYAKIGTSLPTCYSTPNCSNYFIGALMRYGYWSAIRYTYRRINFCGRTTTLTYRADYI